MAFLKVIHGGNPGQVLEIQGEQFLLGRNPTCQVVLDNPAVSRYHAQILQTHGSYYLEDLRSRNRTVLNGTQIEGRAEIHDRDELKICDVVFRFYLKNPLTDPSSSHRAKKKSGSKRAAGGDRPTPQSGVPKDLTDTDPGPGENDDQDSSSSSILSTLNAGKSTHLRLGVQPENKLRAVLEIAKALGRESDIAEVMTDVLEILFRIYPQADEGLVLVRDEIDREVKMIASHTRDADDEVTRPSSTIVRRVMQNREAVLSADIHHDERFDDSQSISDMKIRSTIVAPLVAHPPPDADEDATDDALGVIQINTRDFAKQFSEDDLDLLVSVAAQAVLAVQYDRLFGAMIRQRELQRDLEFATQVQLGFLPTDRPKLEEYEFADHYEAAQNVGGDYFDYVSLPDGRLVISLGDVAGKGVPAALLMVRLHSTARHHLLSSDSVAEAMTGLNKEISASGMGHRFVTCVLAVLDPNEHTLTIANAGHLPPLIKTSKGVTELPRDTFGMPLGIMRDTEYQETTIEIPPDGSVTMFTDGITETMNKARELYGMKRLAELLKESEGTADGLVQTILTDADSFSGGIGQRDDTCIVVMKRK